MSVNHDQSGHQKPEEHISQPPRVESSPVVTPPDRHTPIEGSFSEALGEKSRQEHEQARAQEQEEAEIHRKIFEDEPLTTDFLIGQFRNPFTGQSMGPILLSYAVDGSPLWVQALMANVPEQVLDRESFHHTDILQYIGNLDCTVTGLGSMTLLRSALAPLTDPELIGQKQNAAKELLTHPEKAENVQNFLRCADDFENSLFPLLSGHVPPVALEHAYGDIREKLGRLSTASRALPEFESPYLRTLRKSLVDIATSASASLFSDAAFIQQEQAVTKKEAKFLSASMRYLGNIPTRLMRGTMYAMAAHFVSIFFMGDPIGRLLGPASLLVPMGFMALASGATILKTRQMRMLEPLRRRLLLDRDFTWGLNAIGRLDEVLGFARAVKETPTKMIFPEVREGKFHQFEAKNLFCPSLLGKAYPQRHHDVSLTNKRLLWLSGPNSGGKTSFWREVIQAQILAQMGAPVPAESCSVTIANQIFCQAPSPGDTESGVGRFIAELKRTMEGMKRSSATTLAAFDELAEGTTGEENVEVASDIISTLRAVGASVILVSHNFKLGDKLADREDCQCFKLGFTGTKPSFELSPGISRHSYAKEAANEAGFNRSFINRIIRERRPR